MKAVEDVPDFSECNEEEYAEIVQESEICLRNLLSLAAGRQRGGCSETAYRLLEQSVVALSDDIYTLVCPQSTCGASSKIKTSEQDGDIKVTDYSRLNRCIYDIKF